MIKAILFDMDGVLVEAKEWHYEAFNKALKLFGLQIARSEHLSVFDGLSTRQKLNILTGQNKIPGSLHDFIGEMKQSYTLEAIYAHCSPNDHCIQTLSNLKREGYKIAVCSNAVRETVDLIMNQSQLTPYFDLMLSNSDVTEPKPHPEIYLKAMQTLGLSPDECLILEDNDRGIQAARASGGHLLVIQDVREVTYERIIQHLYLLNGNAT